MPYKGGYLVIPEPLIKAGVYRHTSSLDRPIPDEQLRAINHIQNSPWRINREVYSVLDEAFSSNSVIAALPPSDDIDMPPMLDVEVWKDLPQAEKAEIKAERERIHGANAKASGQRESLLRKLSLCRELTDRSFWFPHAVDWRGRAYSISQDLHPQADDIARGILEFGLGHRLGPDGAYHLALRGAGAFGMDKVDYGDRVDWFLANEKLIIDSATNPLDGERFWCEADKPWSFLATCQAWVGYLNEGDDYVCHLPIPYDATCSGLQHLSAMGLSEFGGRHVNLTADEHRHDIYQVVANKTLAIVTAEAMAGREIAKHWLGHISRKTVKRQTMTLCYGATPMGMRKMALEDGHCDGLPGLKTANAKYITECILQAITDVLTEGSLIMDWLQDCATVIAKENRPIRFTTPIGMTVNQAYYKKTEKRITTLFGEAHLWDEDPELGMDRARMRQAIVPNVIHAYDAAHLYRTVNAVSDQYGPIPWAMVHDSYGTWAGEPTKVMTRVLREQFVDIYSVNQLDHLHRCFQESAPWATLPTPPARGQLNINDVLKSLYFFS